MWQYTLVMFLYITTTYCKASKVSETDTVINTASGKLLGINGNLTPQQIIYVYGPQQWKTQNGVNLIEKAENDFLITPGIGAHKFHNRKLPWYKARKICIQEGGHLAIINSNSEEKILLRLLDENKETQGWLVVYTIYTMRAIGAQLWMNRWKLQVIQSGYLISLTIITGNSIAESL